MSDTAIYLDHAAASPLRPAVRHLMQPFLKEAFGNPASITKLGVAAKTAIDQARQSLASVLQAHPDEFIFTSGGTESTNLAIQGILRSEPIGHAITISIEHQAVLAPINLLARAGYQTTIVPVDQTGVFEPKAILAAIRPETRLISIMLANNEIGTIQPIAEFTKLLRRHNRQRTEQGRPPIYVHTDACQAAAYLSLSVHELGVDALSLNSAKVGGPKGMGLLYLRRGTPFVPLLVGGGQEAGRRSGTENVAAIVGGALALQIAQESAPAESRRLRGLRDQLFTSLTKGLPGLRLNGDFDERLPNNLNLTIPGLDAEALLLYLDSDGVIIGTGAACSNVTLEPSHVLQAIGLSQADALATIRLTLGWNTTATDIKKAAKKIIARVRWLRKEYMPIV